MATGFYDAEGIWQYGEDDPASPFSTTLNLLAESVSTEMATNRTRIGNLETQWGRLTGSSVFTPIAPVTLVDASAVYLPGVMACVHVRLGNVSLASGEQTVDVGEMPPALFPTMYFAPINGWNSGHASGLVSPAGAVSIRWANESSTGSLVFSGTWPL